MQLRSPYSGECLFPTVCLLLALASTHAAGAQTASAPTLASPATIDVKAFASPRELEVAVDTDRLYRLTVELREELAKSGTATLPVAAVKKAEEIERLAHRLNEAMKRK